MRKAFVLQKTIWTWQVCWWLETHQRSIFREPKVDLIRTPILRKYLTTLERSGFKLVSMSKSVHLVVSQWWHYFREQKIICISQLMPTVHLALLRLKVLNRTRYLLILPYQSVSMVECSLDVQVSYRHHSAGKLWWLGGNCSLTSCINKTSI